MATQLSVHNVTRISARAPVEFLPQKRGEEGFWSRTLLLWQGSEIVEVLVFGETEAALMLPGEKPAEARLDAYAGQAREPYVAPELTRNPACPRCNFPFEEGAVDLAAEANPPRFQAGDRVTPVKAGDGLLAGKVYTVDEVHFHSTTGEELTGVEGSKRRWSNTAFRLADEPTF